MHVLVTGSAGYIGSSLVPKLIDAGHTVTGVDTGYFGDCCIDESVRLASYVVRDIRMLQLSNFAGVDAVVHLAALSNDPLGELDPVCTFQINHAAAVRVAELAKAAGAHRFIFSSSCSVYGNGGSTPLSEQDPVHPLTAYAASKVAAESDVIQLADSTFTTVVLRNATAYGYSPMLRFDLMPNYQTGLGYTCGIVSLLDDGSAWRPFVHVDDISNVIILMLSASTHVVNGETFNIGKSSDCLRVRDVADIITAIIPNARLAKKVRAERDYRSYQIDDSKFRNAFPKFRFTYDVAAGIAGLICQYSRIGLTETRLQSEHFRRLPVLLNRLKLGQLDSSLYWVGSHHPIHETDL